MFDLFKHLLAHDERPSQLMLEARDMFLGILDKGLAIIDAVEPHLLRNDPPPHLREEARNADKESNKAERQIRKALVEHLAFAAHDGPACLVLMSVAKDGERLVDECRNLCDLHKILGKATVDDRRIEELQAHLRRVREGLARCRAVFADNDEQGALELVEGEKPFRDGLIPLYEAILDDQKLGQRGCVAAYRTVRGIQRIRAHLGNIASAVVFPVHRIDFAKGSFIKDAKREMGES